MTKDQILTALPRLSRPELEAVQAVATSLLGGRVSNLPSKASQTAEVLFDALAATVSHPVPYSSLPPHLASRFDRHVPNLIVFFDLHFKGWDSHKMVQTGFLRMIFSLIAAHLKEYGVTPSIAMLINNLPRIYEIVDNAFPGYLENNMGYMILKMFNRKRSA